MVGVKILSVVRTAGDVTPTGTLYNGIVATGAKLNGKGFLQAAGLIRLNTMRNRGGTGGFIFMAEQGAKQVIGDNIVLAIATACQHMGKRFARGSIKGIVFVKNDGHVADLIGVNFLTCSKCRKREGENK